MAARQGYPTADAWLEQVDSADIDEWFTYFRVEPETDAKADIRHAMLAYLVAATGGAKNPKIKDFLPDWEQQKKKPMSVREGILLAKQFNAQMGGKFV